MDRRTENIFISIIVPAFNEEGNIEAVAEQIKQQAEQCRKYEIIFINDGSTDATAEKLRMLHRSNPNIQFISFSRNFGHQSALLAGIHHASGDCIISMDADLQHPPAMIPQLVSKWQEGFDIVTTIRDDSQNTSWFKRSTSSVFYKLMNRLSNITLEEGAADFRLIDRSVAQVISNSREYNLFLRGYIAWLGYKQCMVPYIPHQRQSGKTKYSFGKMMMLAINGITSFSVKPLRVAMILGTAISLLAFIYAIYAIYVYLETNEAVPGWTSVLVSILFIGGLQLLILGIIGEYLGRTLMQTKQRPDYVIMEKSLQ
ncbi:MAG: glycosyltransferase family 2 protein [Chitinophagales bacterium]|nr:glycosyltransferase family 2 protein [Chitinophagales bacterium]